MSGDSLRARDAINGQALTLRERARDVNSASIAFSGRMAMLETSILKVNLLWNLEKACPRSHGTRMLSEATRSNATENAIFGSITNFKNEAFQIKSGQMRSWRSFPRYLDASRRSGNRSLVMRLLPERH